MKQFMSVIFFAVILASSSAALAATVTADGKNWRQLTETGGFTFSAIATQCPIGGGACGGTFDGWTWANVTEVQSLFQTYNAAFAVNGGTSDTGSSGTGSNNAWATAFLADFNKTQGAAFNIVSGWTANDVVSPFAGGYFGEVVDSPSGGDDRMRTGISPDASLPGRGIWLYETSPVPLPAAVWLFLSALGGIALGRRKKT